MKVRVVLQQEKAGNPAAVSVFIDDMMVAVVTAQTESHQGMDVVKLVAAKGGDSRVQIEEVSQSGEDFDEGYTGAM